MASVNPRDGRFFTGSFIFRGDIATSEAEELMFGLKKSNPELFKSWIADNFHASFCNTAPKGMTKAVTFLGNTTAVQHTNNRIGSQFMKLFRRKAFLHWYLS